MEHWQRVSALVAVLGPAAVLIYDAIVAIMFGREATITFVVQQWARTYHELPYLVAGLMVWLWLHLFFEVVIHP
jgi:hypothetical protein